MLSDSLSNFQKAVFRDLLKRVWSSDPTLTSLSDTPLFPSELSALPYRIPPRPRS